MAQVSLAWIMSQKGVTAPVVGTTSLEKLYDLLGMFCISNASFLLVSLNLLQLGAVDVKLTEEEKKELEVPYQSQATFGHD